MQQPRQPLLLYQEFFGLHALPFSFPFLLHGQALLPVSVQLFLQQCVLFLPAQLLFVPVQRVRQLHVQPASELSALLFHVSSAQQALRQYVPAQLFLQPFGQLLPVQVFDVLHELPVLRRGRYVQDMRPFLKC